MEEERIELYSNQEDYDTRMHQLNPVRELGTYMGPFKRPWEYGRRVLPTDDGGLTREREEARKAGFDTSKPFWVVYPDRAI